MQRMIVGKTKIVNHINQNYTTIFNQHNGFFARVEDKGYDEPQWSYDGPELLDISITNYCERGCGFCYRQSNPKGNHIAITDLDFILEQCKDIGVFQIALGGGNPNQHPDFIKILNNIRKSDIIPTYTTNGEGLSDEILYATSEYCGAIGISAYQPYIKLEESVKTIFKYGIRINLHVILSHDNIHNIIRWLKNPPEWFDYLNAIIFLNYKPINDSHTFIAIDDQVLEEFFSFVSKSDVKIGFDSCSISGVLKWLNTPNYLIESCEAGKFSAFISEDLKMYPCSFMVNSDLYGDLRKHSIMDIWRTNPAFKNMRNDISSVECTNCKIQSECKGGCKYLPGINLCKNIPVL